MENEKGLSVIDHSFLEETLARKATLTCVSPLDAVIQHFKKITLSRLLERILTFWRRNYFFLNFSTPCI